jgi:hypothetical protein
MLQRPCSPRALRLQTAGRTDGVAVLTGSIFIYIYVVYISIYTFALIYLCVYVYAASLRLSGGLTRRAAPRPQRDFDAAMPPCAAGRSGTLRLTGQFDQSTPALDRGESGDSTALKLLLHPANAGVSYLAAPGAPRHRPSESEMDFLGHQQGRRRAPRSEDSADWTRLLKRTIYSIVYSIG